MGVVYMSIKIFGPLLFLSAQDTKIKYINVLINIQYSKTVLAKLQTFHNSIIRVNTVLTKKPICNAKRYLNNLFSHHRYSY